MISIYVQYVYIIYIYIIHIYIYIYICVKYYIYMYINTCISLDWFKGSVKINPHVYWEKPWSPADFANHGPPSLVRGQRYGPRMGCHRRLRLRMKLHRIPLAKNWPNPKHLTILIHSIEVPIWYFNLGCKTGMFRCLDVSKCGPQH